jgi:hypothetical protein
LRAAGNLTFRPIISTTPTKLEHDNGLEDKERHAIGSTLQPAGSTCTIINEDTSYALLPPFTKGYLLEKVEFALKVPTVIYIKLPDGTSTVNLLKQVAMTAVIRIDEEIAKFYWQYKAEVSFDMLPSIGSNGFEAPIPFLSGSRKAEGPGRPHSLNPFPPGMKPGFLRRPDVIIVKNPMDRWPGRGNVDHDGASHIDNMLRLAEVKFPGDTWGRGQEAAYQAIAGDYKNRMTVIDVSDCDDELKKVREHALKNVPVPQPVPQRQRAPIRTVTPIPGPAWYEDWWSSVQKQSEEAEKAIAPIWDAVHRGYTHVSDETSDFLHQHAPWIFTAGRWIENKANDAWVYVDEKGTELYRYTAAQLKAGWQEIVHQTDMTWNVLKQINWAQIGTTVVKALAAIVVVIAAVALVIVLADALVALLAALVAIIAAASAEGLAALVLVLGETAVESAGPAGGLAGCGNTS